MLFCAGDFAQDCQRQSREFGSWHAVGRCLGALQLFGITSSLTDPRWPRQCTCLCSLVTLARRMRLRFFLDGRGVSTLALPRSWAHFWPAFAFAPSLALQLHAVFSITACSRRCATQDQHVHHTWNRQVKRIATFLMRFFFACSIGFTIPVEDFGDSDVWRTALTLLVWLDS